MALNPSGVMSIGGTTVGASINLELGLSATANSSIGQANFRELAKVPTGSISLSDFYGKSNVIVVPPITTNTAQYTLSPASVPGYVAGETKVELNIGNGVYLYSTDTNVAALTITGFVSGDEININNNGYIYGKGGRGGAGPYNIIGEASRSGHPGGPGIYISPNPSAPYVGALYFITNNGFIAGGGGGGCAGNSSSYETPGGGGGAGGGDGGWGIYYEGYPGTGGGPGQAGTKGGNEIVCSGGGGGGGIFPGTGGIGESNTYPAPLAGGGGGGGSGGAGGGYGTGFGTLGAGLNGGSASSAGVNPVTQDYGAFGGGGGGGWGAMGGSNASFRPGYYLGGAGGKAIALNSNGVYVYGPGYIYGAVI